MLDSLKSAASASLYAASRALSSRLLAMLMLLSKLLDMQDLQIYHRYNLSHLQRVARMLMVQRSHHPRVKERYQSFGFVNLSNVVGKVRFLSKCQAWQCFRK